jgi:hypothetical protein
LHKALQCRQWEVLWSAGGLRDQPLTATKQMEVALFAYDAFKSRLVAMRNGKAAEWAKQNPELNRFCGEIDEMRESE